ncbi:MAG: MbcA/ParS/Xre antitoxin family protein [Mariprofundaceae bacterium]|nr:MbcA/ParS/Xre antitoxin family protein [Mariprofundaceae bacterium]
MNELEQSDIFALAVTTLGSIENAREWMNRPLKELGNKSPDEIMETDSGKDEVINILGRIRHGVFG